MYVGFATIIVYFATFNEFNYAVCMLLNNIYFLRPEKSTLRFFCIKSTSILGNGTVFLLLLREIWL